MEKSSACCKWRSLLARRIQGERDRTATSERRGESRAVEWTESIGSDRHRDRGGQTPTPRTTNIQVTGSDNPRADPGQLIQLCNIKGVKLSNSLLGFGQREEEGGDLLHSPPIAFPLPVCANEVEKQRMEIKLLVSHNLVVHDACKKIYYMF